MIIRNIKRIQNVFCTSAMVLSVLYLFSVSLLFFDRHFIFILIRCDTYYSKFGFITLHIIRLHFIFFFVYEWCTEILFRYLFVTTLLRNLCNFVVSSIFTHTNLEKYPYQTSFLSEVIMFSAII